MGAFPHALSEVLHSKITLIVFIRFNLSILLNLSILPRKINIEPLSTMPDPTYSLRSSLVIFGKAVLTLKIKWTKKSSLFLHSMDRPAPNKMGLDLMLQFLLS